jgi:outer membrane lipoprotein-sorting protein
MKRSLFCISLAVAAVGTSFISTALAEGDVMEALKKAEQAQLDAPAFRMKMVSTDLTSNKTSAVTVEQVKPDLLYWRSEDNGQVTVEMWSDGKKPYMRQGPAGEIHPAPMDVNSLVTQARQVNPLETLITKAREPKLVGHEEVNGVPASVYTFKSLLTGMDSSVKLWISDADSRPLKTDTETQRELKGAPVHKKTVTTYEYDSSIKIVVPQ